MLGEVRVTDPWLFGSDVSGTARVYALMYGREGYDTYETGLDGKLNWKFGDHYTLDLLAGCSVVKLTGDGLPSSELGEKVYTNPRLRLTQTLDFRDNPVLPTNGWHLENPLEIGAAIGDISTSYVMAGLSGGWFHEINRHYRDRNRRRVGHARSLRRWRRSADRSAPVQWRRAQRAEFSRARTRALPSMAIRPVARRCGIPTWN